MADMLRNLIDDCSIDCEAIKKLINEADYYESNYNADKSKEALQNLKKHALSLASILQNAGV